MTDTPASKRARANKWAAASGVVSGLGTISRAPWATASSARGASATLLTTKMGTARVHMISSTAATPSISGISRSIVTK